MKVKILIGLLINDFEIPAWEYQVIKELSNFDFSEISVIIKNYPPETLKMNDRNRRPWIPAKLLEKADRIIFKAKHDYYLKKNVSDLLKDTPILDLYSENRVVESPVITTLKTMKLDILLKFGHHKLEPELLNITRYGIWGYSIDDFKMPYSVDPGFWEVINYNPVSNSTLEIISKEGTQNEVIFNSWESTSPFSINVTRNDLFWRASLFVPRIIKGLYDYGDVYLDRLKSKFRSEISGNQDSLGIPTYLHILKDELVYLIRVTGLTLNKLWYTDAFSWHILFDIRKPGEDLPTDFRNFKTVPSPKGLFWADPFVVAGNDNYYVFVEEFIYKKDKAHLSVLKLDNKGNLLETKRIIERPYHMSYPFIFIIDGTYYMIPETCSNKTIELYKCLDFPYHWEFERNLMENTIATDTTVFYHNNKWWMFTTIDQTDGISGSSTELFLFFSDNVLTGKWEGHPMNPVVSDSRNARMAGKLFVRDSEIYRPSQDCSIRYGRALNLNEVTKLTIEEYYETKVYRKEPHWDKRLKGIHTLNFDKDFTVIDVYSYHSRLSFK